MATSATSSNDFMTGLRVPKDEEVGLLSQQAKSTRAATTALPKTASRTSMWAIVAMTTILLVGLVASILNVFHLDVRFGRHDVVESSRTAKRGSLKTSPLNFLVVGDWGRQGQYNQSAVASQMGRIGADLDVDFIVSTGDNFYKAGLYGVDDPLFTESFTNIYQAPSLQKTWYAVLGNHDYRGNPDVQVDERLKIRDSRWQCDYTYTLAIDLDDSGTARTYVELFFIDTSPFQEYYWEPSNTDYQWTRNAPREEVTDNQLKTLKKFLDASSATWKIVVGHHTIFSYGNHGVTQELVDKVVPLLEDYQVDLYINGHDHCLEHTQPSKGDIHFVTSGGGSKAWKGIVPPSNADDLKFYYDGQGFTSLSVSPTSLLVNFYDITGKIVHQISLLK